MLVSAQTSHPILRTRMCHKPLTIDRRFVVLMTGRQKFQCANLLITEINMIQRRWFNCNKGLN